MSFGVGFPAAAEPVPASGSGAGAAAAERPRTLEIRGDNVISGVPESGPQDVVASACRCRRRVCPGCGSSLGRTVRRSLQGKAGLFSRPAMVTLTIDPKNFSSAESAHDYVTERRYVARLFDLLGVRVWVWVLEFQKNGWPHWHVLVDLASVGRLDYRKCWKLWRDRWHLGGLKISKPRSDLTPAHAVNYITKYMVKYPEDGFPEWVMDRHRVRFVGSSKAVGALIRPDQCDGPESEVSAAEIDTEGEPERARPGERSNRAATLLCGWSCNLWRREAAASGEVRYRWVGNVEARLEELQDVAAVYGIGRLWVEDDDKGRSRLQVVYDENVRVEAIERALERWRGLSWAEQAAALELRGVTRDDSGERVFVPCSVDHRAAGAASVAGSGAQQAEGKKLAWGPGGGNERPWSASYVGGFDWPASRAETFLTPPLWQR